MSDVTDQLDKRHFELSPEDWEKFKAAVDAPPKFNARLVALLGRYPLRGIPQEEDA